MDETDEEMIKAGIGVDLTVIKTKWEDKVTEVLTKATLTVPENPLFSLQYGKNGHHTDYMGYILLDLQYLNSKYPDAKW
jgi:ring-1,2-phenylacetyl-CoA epoxidase subunit PaaC